MAAAARLIELHGCETFSLRQAASAVGVSPNATYRHFPDRSALLTAVAAGGFTELARRMQDAMSSTHAGSDAEAAVERFSAVARAYVDLAIERPQIFRLMFGPSGLCRLVEETADFPSPSPTELLGRILDDLVAVGRLPPQYRPGAELQAWAIVHGFTSIALDGAADLHDGPKRSAALEALLNVAVVGLCDRTVDWSPKD